MTIFKYIFNRRDWHFAGNIMDNNFLFYIEDISNFILQPNITNQISIMSEYDLYNIWLQSRNYEELPVELTLSLLDYILDIKQMDKQIFKENLTKI